MLPDHSGIAPEYPALISAKTGLLLEQVPAGVLENRAVA
jgi:hypothetical protein